jgi:hypothetical protein
MLSLSREPDDRRAEQRSRVQRELDRLVADLQRDNTSPRLVLNGLVAAARKLHHHLEDVDPILPRGSGRAAS